MTWERELVDMFVQTLRDFTGGWLTIRTARSRVPTLDAGRGRFSDSADLKLSFDAPSHADVLVSVKLDGRQTVFVGEVYKYMSPGRVLEARRRLQESALEIHAPKDAYGLEPLVIVGYMTQATREALRKNDVSYFDSSGSFYLRGSNFVVQALGRDFPSEFKRRGGGTMRMDSPKASRVVRAVLAGFQGGVRDLAATIAVDPGYVSRVLSSLTGVGYLRRHPGSSLLEVSYSLEDDARGELLEAWSSAPRPFWRKKTLFRVPQPDPDALERDAMSLCKAAGIRSALTLWCAANKYTEVTTIPTVAVYCESPSGLSLDALGAKAVSERENLWLLTPRDEGVFQFGQEHNGLTVVHPVQLYYDLMHAPYRGESAADMIRSQVLGY